MAANKEEDEATMEDGETQKDPEASADTSKNSEDGGAKGDCSTETEQTFLEDTGEEDPEENDEIEEGEEVPSLLLAKARGDVDQWVKYLDDTDVSHRLRSLCKKGDLEGLTKMLESKEEGLDIDALSEEGWTCLHEIITHECQFTEVARILLRFGASVNTQDLHGDTPLHSALLYHNAENIELLLKSGSDLTLTNGGGRMPIHVADDVDTLKLMLENKADPDAQDRIGNTPLHYAAVSRDRERVALLLKHAKNVNLKNRAGSTPLHVSSDHEIAQMLLDAGSDPNSLDTNACSPLHVAVRGRHKEMVRSMLEKNADSSLVNSTGKTPLNLAKDKEMKNILLGKANSSSKPSSPVPSSANGPGAKKGPRKSALAVDPEYLEQLMATVAPKCTSPGILKRKRAAAEMDDEEESPEAKRKGPRLRFSEVNDYSGVEVVEEEKRVKITPIYSEPTFSSDED